MNTHLYALKAMGFGLASSVLMGCQSQQVISEQQEPLALCVHDTTTNEAAKMTESSLWMGVLYELELIFDGQFSQVEPQSYELPRLVAGDWLAIECAFAGGYWDLRQEKGTPVFAEVPESWSFPE